MSTPEPRYDPTAEDLSEVEVCRGCRELIEPGTEDYFNDWAWHHRCLPVAVIEGRERESRDDMARGK